MAVTHDVDRFLWNALIGCYVFVIACGVLVASALLYVWWP